MRDENMIAALKRERAGYAAAGLTDRVAQVDEQIKAYGGEVPEEPEGRQAPPKSTADSSAGDGSEADKTPKPGARRRS